MTRPFPKLFWYTPPVLWAAIIFWLSSRQVGPESPHWILSHDKIIHGIIFGILCTTFIMAFRFGAGWPTARAALVAVALTSFYGATDEFHQRFVPTRQSDPKDWLADTGGAALFALPFLLRPRAQTDHEPAA